MMKRIGSSILIVGLVFLLGACAQKVAAPYAPVAPQDLSAKVAGGEYVAKVDNFLLLLDASSSMARPYTVGTRFETAKGLTETLSETLPELSWQGGLRYFGPRFEGYGRTVRLYGMAPHSRAGIAAALAQVEKPSGITPLAAALREAGADLADLKGDSALVIFSDGEVESAADVLAAAAEIKQVCAYEVCLYPVLVGDSAAGRDMLEEVVRVLGCGEVYQADQLLSGQAMAAFAAKAFLMKPVEKPPVLAEPPVAVDEPVFHTEARRLEVNFAFDRADIRPADHAALARFADFLKVNPQIEKVEIAGHTCNMGPVEYNRKLSQRRAESVVKFLVERQGIASERLSAMGYGLSKPMADNATLLGRQQNRRVEAVVTTLVKQ